MNGVDAVKKLQQLVMIAMLMMLDDKLCSDKLNIMFDADDKLMKTFYAKHLVMLRTSQPEVNISSYPGMRHTRNIFSVSCRNIQIRVFRAEIFKIKVFCAGILVRYRYVIHSHAPPII